MVTKTPFRSDQRNGANASITTTSTTREKDTTGPCCVQNYFTTHHNAPDRGHSKRDQGQGADLNMNEYTTHADVRELDNLYLATIANVDYYEERWIVKRDSGVRSIVGKASDWPLIAERARVVELTALLTASERRSVEADCHVVELLDRERAYRDHIAALEAALAELSAPPEIPPAAVAAAEQAFVQAAGPATPPIAQSAPDPATDVRRKCPYCPKRPFAKELQAHIDRDHATQPIPVALPPPEIELALGDAPWRCANPTCGGAHARSIAQPQYCKKCVIELTDTALSNGHTNGHQVVT